MARRTGEPQGFAAQAILSHFARGIAVAILQWDRRDQSVSLDQLDRATRIEYEQLGELYALMNDEQAMRLAFYCATDEMVAGGIDRLTPDNRAMAIGLYMRAFKAMKDQLMAKTHHEKAALMRTLLERDLASGINRQPMNTKPSSTIGLADLATAPEVH